MPASPRATACSPPSPGRVTRAPKGLPSAPSSTGPPQIAVFIGFGFVEFGQLIILWFPLELVKAADFNCIPYGP